MRKRILTGLCVAAVVAGLGAPAMAAAPGNDERSGATPVDALPYSDTVDTSQATTDGDDADLNAQCGAPVTNGSVWYSYTAPADVDGIVVDISASSFSAGAIIAEPDGNGGWAVVACGPGVTGTTVAPGGQHLILAFSDTPGVTGGTLRITVDEATVPDVSVTVNPKGKVDRNGNAILSGTYTCTGGDFLSISESLKQSVGRFAILGDGYADGSCDGTTQPWTAVVVPYNGKFAGGKAASFTYAFSCGALFCSDSYEEHSVKLSK
jgi:hypothetical protein